MTPFATALVIISALIHALWNLMGKRQNPSAGFFLIASFFAALMMLPLPIFYRTNLAILPPALWVLLTITGIFQTVYYVGLAGAYRRGDISLAYPFVRALPVVFVAALSALLSIGDPLSRGGVAGIALVVIGCLVLPLPDFRELHWRAYLNPTIPLALLAAVGTVGYTLIDNRALSILRGVSPAGQGNTRFTLLFLALETTITTLILAIYTLILPSERARLQITWNNGRSKAALAGILITVTYGLVLLAMNFASNISYIVAFRQLSIPLAALLGFIVLKEPTTPPKIAGIALVFGGLVLVGIS